MADQRAAINARHPLPTWQAFLQGEAERGDKAALGVLRSQVAFRRKEAADVLTAADMAAARDVIFRRLDPRARRRAGLGPTLDLKAARNGDLVYRVADDGKVTDTKGEVRCDDLSVHAAFLTLSIAAGKFAGQALIIAGTHAFKGAVIEAASLPGWDIRFADPAMEAARLAAVAERGTVQSEAQVARGSTRPVSAAVPFHERGRSVNAPDHEGGILR